MNTIALFGAGSHLAFEYQETCQRLGRTIAFCVRNTPDPARCGDDMHIRQISELTPKDFDTPFLVPLFTPANRRAAVRHATELGFHTAATLIDPTAIVAQSVEIGKGGFVNAGTVIGAAGRFGNHVTVNRASSIGHHATLHDYASVGPGCTLCGNVTIGKGTLIGAGAIILPGVSIGANAIVGAGTVVTRDIAANTKRINRVENVTSPIDPDQP